MQDVKTNFDAASVLDVAAESILITDANLEFPGPFIVYANPAFEAMTGWSNSELIGKSPRVLQGDETDLNVFSNLKKKLTECRVWEGLTINYRKDGTKFWMEWSIVPLKNENGEDYWYVAVQRDVSARIKAEQELKEAQISEQEAERARSNLARYFSPKLTETLAQQDQPFGYVRRQNMAVLFVDIVGFTSLSEEMEPEQVIHLLRDVHKWMAAVIFKFEGSIEGYIGDAALAIFGFPKVGEKDASNALSCALELFAAARDWNQKRALNGLATINIGVGMQYGEVVLGDVGTEDFVEFTVIGDTVNIASRLQQETRKLKCDMIVGQEMVDAIVRENAGSDVNNLLAGLQSYGNLAIRGKRQIVNAWTFTASS